VLFSLLTITSMKGGVCVWEEKRGVGERYEKRKGVALFTCHREISPMRVFFVFPLD